MQVGFRKGHFPKDRLNLKTGQPFRAVNSLFQSEDHFPENRLHCFLEPELCQSFRKAAELRRKSV